MKVKNFRDKKEIMKKFITEARKRTNITLLELSNILGILKSTVANYDKK